MGAFLYQVFKFIFLLMVLIQTSCGNYTYQKRPQKIAEKSNDAKNDAKLVLDFLTVKELVFTPRCISCHQRYNNYQDVLQDLNSIQEAVRTNRMPKNGSPLSDSQKAALFAWISEGAPNSQSELKEPELPLITEPNLPIIPSNPITQPQKEPPEMPISPVPNNPSLPIVFEPNWEMVSEQVIFPKCLSCHNPQGMARFIDLSTKEAILSIRDKVFSNDLKFIDLENPELSYLLKIVKDEERLMPPVWSGITKLNEKEIETLSQWIRLGLP